MKIAERLIDNHDGTFTVKKTYDNQGVIDLAKTYQDIGAPEMASDSVCVGLVPMNILAEWFKEAGVDWSDSEACGEIIKKKMLSGDFDKLRVWEGRY